MNKYKPGSRVQVIPALALEFPQLLSRQDTKGTVEATKWVNGIPIVIVNFDNGIMRKLPAAFVVPLVDDSSSSHAQR